MKIRIKPWDWQRIIGTIFMTPLMVAVLCGLLGFIMEPSLIFEEGIVGGLAILLFFAFLLYLYYLLVFPGKYVNDIGNLIIEDDEYEE